MNRNEPSSREDTRANLDACQQGKEVRVTGLHPNESHHMTSGKRQTLENVRTAVVGGEGAREG